MSQWAGNSIRRFGEAIICRGSGFSRTARVGNVRRGSGFSPTSARRRRPIGRLKAAPHAKGNPNEPDRERHAARADVLLPVRRRAGFADGEGRRRRGDRSRAELLRGRRPSGRRQGLRQGLRAGAEDLQPASGIDADEAHQPEEGPRRGSGVRADLLGRGARSRRGEAQRSPRGGTHRRVGLSAARGEPGRRRHAAVVHGHVPRVPRRLGTGRHGLRVGPGREVLPLRAPLRRVLAPRVHRVARHAALRIPDLLRSERRGVGRRRRRLAARQCARARNEARAGRAAPLGHRRVLRRMGADPAEDRRRVPLRARPRPAARDSARAARRRVPRAAHRVAVSGRAARLLSARPDDEEAARVGHGARHRGAARRAGHRRGARRPSRSRRRRDRSRRRRPRRRPTRRRNRLRQARRAHGAVFAGMGGADLRRCRRDDAPDRERVHRSRACRRDDRDRGHALAVPAGGRQSRQDREQRLGRLRVRLGAHAAGRARRRSRSARRHARHDGAAESPGSGARRQRARGSRRLHGLSAQSDGQGALVAQSEHPQRVPDDGAARGERAVEPGARTDAFLVDVPRRDAEGVAAGDAAGRVDRLPDQPGDLVLGHRGARAEDGALPVHGGVRVHPRRDQPLCRRAAARGDRPREPAADPDRRLEIRRAVLAPSRALRCASRRSRRAARRAISRRSRPSSRAAPVFSTSTTAPSTRARPASRSRASTGTTRSRRATPTRRKRSGTRSAARRAPSSPTARRNTISPGGRRTGSRPRRSRRPSGISSRRSPRRACASSSPTRSACSASASSSAGGCTSTTCAGGTSS